jgi:hypothetical protein
MKQVTMYKVFVYNRLSKQWRLIASHKNLGAAQYQLRRYTESPNATGNIIEDVVEQRHS